jgi:hypothetical protein
VLLPVRARLNALKASAQSGNLPPGDLKHIEEIRRSIAYLQQLADGLHFLAIDPTVEDEIRSGVTDLRQWWVQTGPLLSKPVPKHVRVSASFPADLPPVAVAPHRLTQAVLNLIVNAGEAIPGPSERKRRQGHVRLWAQRTGDGRVRLGVTDNGSGMSDEVKRRAFEMFFTTKPRGLGTGLGLALVHKVVDQAGGRVEIKSEKGTGTTVALIVPAAERAGVGTTRKKAAVSVPDGRAAALIRHLLESSGISVHEGDEPADAAVFVVAPAATKPDLAVAWRARNPRGRVVLFGEPRAGEWKAWMSLDPLTIRSTDDFEAIRAVLSQASSAN